MFKVLVACEESQRVTKCLRDRGVEAYSCDIIDCSGGCPEWHVKADVLPLLNGNCKFYTCDNVEHEVVGKWDMIIAFPPCTDLAVSGARHFEKKRIDGRQRESIEFFAKFLNADCDKIAIENPVGIISGEYIVKWFPDIANKYGFPIKPTQIIQPYEYGEPYRKTTCLWLKGLPVLKPTKIVKPLLKSYVYHTGKTATYSIDMINTGKDRAKNRSKTYLGVAEAMAKQWGDVL
jgi:hypothetical protein